MDIFLVLLVPFSVAALGLLDIALESQHHPCFRRSIRSARFVDCSFLLEAMSSVSQRVTSNKSLEPTASCREVHI